MPGGGIGVHSRICIIGCTYVALCSCVGKVYTQLTSLYIKALYMSSGNPADVCQSARQHRNINLVYIFACSNWPVNNRLPEKSREMSRNNHVDRVFRLEILSFVVSGSK